MEFSQNKSFARYSHKKYLVILLAFRRMSREVIKKAENEIKIINYEIIKTSILDIFRKCIANNVGEDVLWGIF